MRKRDESLLGRGETRERGFQLDSNELAVGGRLKGNSLDRATGQRKYGFGARISRRVEGCWLVMPHCERTRPWVRCG
jgi:hypothetical protein